MRRLSQALPILLLLVSTRAGVSADPARASKLREEQRSEFAGLPKVADPSVKPGENPIDAILASDRLKSSVSRRPPAPDYLLIRRMHLDTTGLLPTPEQVSAFVGDPDPRKVEKTADALLGEHRAYAENWITFWNDLLRNDEQTNIDGLRKPITTWLYRALVENRPYDAMVGELLNPVGPDAPDGYLKGVNWRGRVNLSQRPPVQAAQNVAQVFLATSIRCASCHDGFTTTWKLRDAYGLASFFSDEKLELARCDKPLGEFVPAKFLYPGLGEVPADADPPTRRAAIARMVTRPKNARFAKVLVNRLWDRLLGRALAEPIDEMGEPACPEVLDWLAYDFMRHDYDLKHVIRTVITSKHYRRTAADVSHSDVADDPAVELGPIPRRLSGEQLLDAMGMVSDHWPRPFDMVGVRLDGKQVRAWRHKRPSPLVTALGRPNREQVVTRRVQGATVLQALEATNGVTLSRLVQQGATALLGSPLGKDSDPGKTVDAIFLRAYSRPATAEEKTVIAPMLGKPGDPQEDRKAGFEDVLWMIFNSPEFQMIR